MTRLQVDPSRIPERPIDAAVDSSISATQFIDEAIGRRYVRCLFSNFSTGPKESEKKQAALDACRDYVENFPQHYEAGRSLVIVGPKGTGKDHLLTATIREIATRLKTPGKVIFRDGLRLFSEFRASFGTAVTEDKIIDKYIAPKLLAISDPLPPRGTLSEHEQRMALRIIDGRYRESLPMATTINAVNRAEISDRLGAQATDRLFDCAIVVRCVWESYRMENFK
jgi:DNA replication protein DnaC